MTKYLVYTADELVPDAPSACCSEWGSAVEMAAAHRGYVVRRVGEAEDVVWVSSSFDIVRMMAAMVRAWTPEMREWLIDRTTEIKSVQRALRQKEAA